MSMNSGPDTNISGSSVSTQQKQDERAVGRTTQELRGAFTLGPLEGD